jgi:hypothetical protein
MRARFLPSFAALSWSVLVACGGSGPGGSGRPAGQESFLAQGPGGAGAGAASGGLAPNIAGAAAPGGATSAPRTVEEADLYALAADGKTLFVLNGFRGLEIVGLDDLDHPALLARVPATGSPLDLYVRGTVAYFTVSDAVVWAWAAGDAAVRPRGGSQLWAVDVSDRTKPRVLSRLDLEGSAIETRIVGDVLYVFSRRYGWWDVMPVGGAGVAVGAATGGASTGVASPATSANLVYLASFDISDPAAPKPVQTVQVDATGWDVHANVTAERVTLAQSGWDASGEVTDFSVFDISDPGGAISSGASFQASGRVVDRWAMDYDGAGLFRAALATGWNGGALLRTWSSPAPGAAAPLGQVAVGAGEGLTAARFDGARAYVVTARQVDPLYVIDTSDPKQPQVGGALHMPGWLDFIEPRGTKLLALGHTNEAGPWQLAVSLFDVSSAAAPVMKGRVLFGDGYGWVDSSRDDLRKAFQVLGSGLVLVPFQCWSQATWRWSGGVQLLQADLAAGTLLKRGFLGHPGSITRAFPLPVTGQLAALSDQSLQIVDATNLDAPAERSRIDLARSVVDIAFPGVDAVELAGDYWRGDTELVVVDPGDPDAATPLARVAVPAPQARLFTHGTTAWILAQDWTVAGATSWLQAVDLADPLHPRLAGRVDVASPGGQGSGWGWGDEAVVIGDLLAVHRQAWRGGPLATGGASAPAVPRTDEVLLYDLSDADAPALVGRAALPDSDWSWGLVASGGQLWITQFTWSPETSGWGRYDLDRIDPSRPDAPRVDRVNVPGVFVGAVAGGDRVYTLEWVWPQAADAAGRWTPKALLHALDLTDHGTARLAASVEIAGSTSGAVLAGGWAYLGTSEWNGSETRSSLVTVDLGRMAIASTQAVAGYAYPMSAAGGKLFVAAWGSGSSILVYGLADASHPAFEQSVHTPGWAWKVVVADGRAYLPCGPYGVPVVLLAP